MPGREERFPRAIAAARRLLFEAGVAAPEHINIEAIARAQGVEIIVGPLVGATARVMRLGDVARIRVSDRVTDPAVRRFSIAHELGHLVLEHELTTPSEAMDPITYVVAECQRRRRNGIDPEAEANAFASEALMPDTLARKRCEVSPVSLELVHSLARTFGTSAMASAIRFAELTSERCAAVYSQRGAVTWSVSSPTFSATIARGRKLDRRSVADDYFRKGTIDDRAQLVAADAWIDCEGGDTEITEHSVAVPELRAVLSLLWVPEESAASLGMID